MKKKLLFTTLFSLIFFVSAFSQEMNRIENDPKTNTQVMIGPYNLQIAGIPDFILFYHSKEIGRIVGSQKTNIEKELKGILQKVD